VRRYPARLFAPRAHLVAKGKHCLHAFGRAGIARRTFKAWLVWYPCAV
jgi:hypothetical protein